MLFALLYIYTRQVVVLQSFLGFWMPAYAFNVGARPRDRARGDQALGRRQGFEPHVQRLRPKTSQVVAGQPTNLPNTGLRSWKCLPIQLPLIIIIKIIIIYKLIKSSSIRQNYLYLLFKSLANNITIQFLKLVLIS